MTDRVKTGVSLDELMQHEWVEVIDGEIVEMDRMGANYEHKVVTDNLFLPIQPHVKANNLGRVFNDGLDYLLHVNEDGVQTMRVADCSFIRRENLKRDFDKTKGYPGAPDLAVEVVSPSERSTQLMAKVTDYLRFGTEQVWLIYPAQQELHSYFRDDPHPKVYKSGEVLEPAALFPGLKIAIADLFLDE